MCSFLPFFQTTSLLSGSMSLVSIALDRYMAIFSKRKGHWQPGWKFCVIGSVIVWSISAALSSPMLFSYEMFKIFIVPEVEENFYIGYYCIIDSKVRHLTNGFKYIFNNCWTFFIHRRSLVTTTASYSYSYSCLCCSHSPFSMR